MFLAALALDTDSHRAVAAYLFGIAAECALKVVASQLAGGRAKDIQRVHFPDLRIALRRLPVGRKSAELRRLVESDSFMNQWAIDIRYSRKEDIKEKQVATWRENARAALRTMEGWA